MGIQAYIQPQAYTFRGQGDCRVRYKQDNGFVWNKKQIYLSTENQLNFSAIERSENIPYPLTLKINEQEDGTPIYHTFENADDFIAFSQSVCAYVIKTVQDGWREKDSVDWTMFNLK